MKKILAYFYADIEDIDKGSTGVETLYNNPKENRILKQSAYT